MKDAELLFMSATATRALIRDRRLSAAEYLDVVLRAVAREQPRLNAFVTMTVDDARAAAKQADQAQASGKPLGPLHGVPISIKDTLDVGGVVTKRGTAILADNIAARDNVLVQRLKTAGAIVIGKTSTPEFAIKGLTDSPSFGITRNPWNLERTPGGSSGGAAAAVAAGLGPIALGTDGGGSVRGPAACCGLVGLKPTLGVVPVDAVPDTFGNYIYAGPLTRTVTDAALALSVLRGPTNQDAWSALHGGGERLSPKLIGSDLTSVRIGYIERCANARVSTDVATNTKAALDAWADLGAVVEPVNDEIDWIELEGRILYHSNYNVSLSHYLPQWRDQMDPATITFMERASQFTLTDLRKAEFARTNLFRVVQRLLSRYDVLVTPTTTRSALPIGFDAANDEVQIDGIDSGLTRVGWTSYQYPFNLTGHPAMTVPSGFADDGLPTGVQIIGRWGADTDVLRFGALLEQVRPWAQHRPGAAR